LIRSVIILLTSYFLLNPVLKQRLHKWLQRKNSNQRAGTIGIKPAASAGADHRAGNWLPITKAAKNFFLLQNNLPIFFAGAEP
jgi:hypothetical protein